jgi:hypothetical protein
VISIVDHRALVDVAPHDPVTVKLEPETVSFRLRMITQ